MRVVRDNENAIDAKWGYVLTIQFITENSINLDQESEKKDLHCLKNMVWREYYDINPLHQNNTESNHGVPIMNIGIDKSRIEIFNLGWCCVTQFNNVEYRREMVTANQIVKLMATMGSFLVKWPKNKNNFENIWEFFFFPFFFFFVFCFLFFVCFLFWRKFQQFLLFPNYRVISLVYQLCFPSLSSRW